MQENCLNLFITKLSQRIQNGNMLELLIKKFSSDYGLIPVVGYELEFYLSENTDTKKLEEMISRKLKAEKGKNQYEIDLDPTHNILNSIEIFYKNKESITNSAEKIGGKVNFEAKPYHNDYGSSVHIHVNLINKDKVNFFEVEKNILQGSRSICHFILETFLVFANKSDHYARVSSPNMNPINVSMGKNNRTTSLRIPYSLPKRIEHRLSAPDVDLYIALYVILKSIYQGMKYPELITNYEIIHGNAFDSQYNCYPFPTNINHAKNLFNINFFDIDFFYM